MSCSPAAMDYDRILTQLGEFGPWQQRNAFLLWLPAVGAGINVLIAAFAVMPPPEFRCQNECDGDSFNFTVAGHNMSEIFPSWGADEPDYCEYYKATPQSDGSCSFSTTETLKCKRGAKFAYEPFDMDTTVAQENDLICGDYYWTIIIDEMFMVGLMIGSFVFGVMSDKIGRRHTLVIAIVCCAVGNFLCCAMPNHWYTLNIHLRV